MLKNFISATGAGFFVLAGGAIASLAPNNLAASTPSYQVAQASINTSAIEASVFQQVNQYRLSKKLPPLKRNSAIDNQARIHSGNMASGKVAFGHGGFQARVKATGITYSRVAENVAYNRGSQDPATQAVQGWLRSSGHLANIQGDYNLSGIGVATNRQGAVYFTQIFMRSR
jgi:uncharacterized protein YkwD